MNLHKKGRPVFCTGTHQPLAKKHPDFRKVVSKTSMADDSSFLLVFFEPDCGDGSAGKQR